MKIILSLLLLGLFHTGFSQTIDTASIAFKAKLMTLDRKGYFAKEKQIKEIENQKLDFIDYKSSDNWIFMRIKYDQNYGNYDGDGYILRLGNCDFYLAFRKEGSVFYRLGGFDKLDLEDFINDLKEDVIEYYDVIDNKKIADEIPFECIENYLKKKKRKKNLEYSCFDECSKVMKTTLIVY